MKLLTALRVQEGEMIALMGAGGKTTALFRLADEAREHGWRVISTTLEPMAAKHITRAPRHLSASAANRATLETLLDKHGHVLVTGAVDATLGRATGVSVGLLAELSPLPDVMMIECESAQGHLLNLPSPSAVPDFATVIVLLVGLEILGQPLTAEYVAQAAEISALTQTPLGAPVTLDIIAAVLTECGRRLAVTHPASRVVPVLNQADSVPELDSVRASADRLLSNSTFDSVVLASAKKPKSAREVRGRVAAVVLAAGRSTRMGRPKQTLAWGESTLLGTVLAQLQGLGEIVVVTGAERDSVEAIAAQFSNTRCVFNPDFATTDMARSLQVGLEALPTHCQAALVALADQPHLSATVIEQVVQRWRETLAPAVVPFFNDQRGNPVLMDRALWPTIMALPSSATPREALRGVAIERVAVDTNSILLDVDTPDDYAHHQRTAHHTP